MKTKMLLTLLCVVMLCFSSIRCSSYTPYSVTSDLIAILDKIPQVSQFTKLLKTPGLDVLLGSVLKKPFTLLAPTNDAMKSLGSSALSKLASPTNINKLADFVKSQIIPGKLNASELMKSGLKSASGKAVELGASQLGKMVSGDKFNLFPINKILGV